MALRGVRPHGEDHLVEEAAGFQLTVLRVLFHYKVRKEQDGFLLFVKEKAVEQHLQKLVGADRMI